MVVTLGVVAALVVGSLAGGRVQRLAGLRLAWWQAAPVALAVQQLALYGSPGLDRAVLAMALVGSHLALLLVALRNWRTFGAAVAAVGLAMNLAVMVANGGLMPMAPDTLEALRTVGRVESWRVGDGSPGTVLAQSKNVIVPRADTRLELLADRFPSGLPGRLNVVFSLGDIVLMVGVFAGIVRVMTYEPCNTPPEEQHGSDTADRRAQGALAAR